MPSEKIWSKNFVLLMFSLLLVACANYYFASSIAIYAELISNSTLYAGLVTSAFYVSSVGMRLVNGVLVQKYGSHRLMLGSAAICAVACFAHRYAATIALVVLFRVIHGAAYSMFNTASGTAASFLVPRSRLTEGIGYFALGNVLALALGPMIALSMISDVTQGEFNRLFMVAAAFCIVAALLVGNIKSSPVDVLWSKKVIEPADLPPTFLGFEQGVVLPVLITFMLGVSYAAAFVYLAAYGLSRGWGSVGGAYMMYALGLCLSRLFAGRLGDRKGPDYVMFPAVICGSVALCGIAFCSTVWQLYLSMTLMGLCVGAFNPQMNVFCILRCSTARRGTATAAFNGSSDLGLAAGSAIAGLGVARFGFELVYLAGSVGCLLTLLVYTLTLSRFAVKRPR